MSFVVTKINFTQCYKFGGCLDLSREPMIHSNRVIEESLIEGPFAKVSRELRETTRD